jgi:hypothetical protein
MNIYVFRKASFTLGFAKDKLLGQNIVHYFPEACRGLSNGPAIKMTVTGITPIIPFIPPALTTTTIDPNHNIGKKLSTPYPTTTTTTRGPDYSNKEWAKTPRTTTTTRAPDYSNKEWAKTPRTTTTTTPKPKVETKFGIDYPNYKKNSCHESNQVVLKIPFENTEYCDLSGTLTIPFEGMNTEMFKALKRNTDKSDVIAILKLFVKMLESS